MTLCIAWAEEQIDCHAGSQFEGFVGTEEALDVSVDRFGALILHMYRPIVSISQVQIMDPSGPITWQAQNIAFEEVLPLGDSVRLGNYRARVFTQPRFNGPLYKGQLMALVTYEAGWGPTLTVPTSIPDSLESTCNSLAHFDYLRREMPAGVGSMNGVDKVAIEMPDSLYRYLDGWRNLPV
jgi:hypothetical protein